MHLLQPLVFFVVFLRIHSLLSLFIFFFFNDTATTEIYTLSLHDALPISLSGSRARGRSATPRRCLRRCLRRRSEEHTSELQSLTNLVCRLLLEKKKKTNTLKPTRRSSYKHHRASDYRPRRRSIHR